jgi:hypothetical protein
MSPADREILGLHPGTLADNDTYPVDPSMMTFQHYDSLK